MNNLHNNERNVSLFRLIGVPNYCLSPVTESGIMGPPQVLYLIVRGVTTIPPD